jgi:hypothetical protein
MMIECPTVKGTIYINSDSIVLILPMLDKGVPLLGEVEVVTRAGPFHVKRSMRDISEEINGK